MDKSHFDRVSSNFPIVLIVYMGHNLPLQQKLVCSLAAGAIGSFVGCPCDLILVRMQADTMLPPEKRRGYKNIIYAGIKIS